MLLSSDVLCGDKNHNVTSCEEALTANEGASKRALGELCTHVLQAGLAAAITY
jgi:hypothetical protein